MDEQRSQRAQRQAALAQRQSVLAVSQSDAARRAPRRRTGGSTIGSKQRVGRWTRGRRAIAVARSRTRLDA
jgi:hypothetical protein